MKLPDSLRNELKIPLGNLIPDNQVSKKVIEEHILDSKYVVTVGDRTTERMIEFGLIPSLQIIDNLEKREKRTPPDLGDKTIELSLDNPPAEITPKSIDLIKKAFTMKPPIRITVRGEEDLLVIPVCIFCPDDTVVLYGQPHEGLVIVKVTAEIRNKTQTLLDSMK